MKKIYYTPQTSIVAVSTVSMIAAGSINTLGGEASEGTKGFSRSDNDWDDED